MQVIATKFLRSLHCGDSRIPSCLAQPSATWFSARAPSCAYLEPRRVEAIDVVVSNVAEGHRKAVVRLLGEEFTWTAGIKNVQQSISELRLVRSG